MQDRCNGVERNDANSNVETGLGLLSEPKRHHPRPTPYDRVLSPKLYWLRAKRGLSVDIAQSQSLLLENAEVATIGSTWP